MSLITVGHHYDFRIGFIEGYRSERGGNVVVPVVPATPKIPDGASAFQVGLQRGFEAANS